MTKNLKVQISIQTPRKGVSVLILLVEIFCCGGGRGYSSVLICQSVEVIQGRLEFDESAASFGPRFAIYDGIDGWVVVVPRCW